MVFKKDNWLDRVVTSSPINKLTARVTLDDAGEQPDTDAIPYKIRKVPQGSINLTGLRFGHLRVVGFSAKQSASGAKGMARKQWVVVCSCGEYERRRAQSIANNLKNPDARCRKCEAKELRARKKAAGGDTLWQKAKKAERLERYQAFLKKWGPLKTGLLLNNNQLACPTCGTIADIKNRFGVWLCATCGEHFTDSPDATFRRKSNES